MGKTFKELKEISQGLADFVGVSYDVAASVVASFSAVGEWDQVDAIAGGDMDSIKEGFKRAGAVLPDCSGSVYTPKADYKTEKQKTDKTITKPKKALKKPIKADVIQDNRITAGAAVLPSYDMEYVRGELPAGLADSIKAFIKEWAASNDIEDISKCDGLQWRAACIYVGEWIKSNDILIDKDAQRARGGRQYDGEKVVKLLEIFQAIATTFKKVPIHTDFISFSGISRNWFFDYEGRGLTSSNVQIVKKCVDIEKAATSAKILNSRDNPLNSIWYEKTRFGIRDNDNMQPIQDEKRQGGAALPWFKAPELPQNSNI